MASIDYNQAEHEDVLRLYAAFFNRQPDAAGARYWIVDIYEGLGANLDMIAAEFALSQEFQNTYGSVNNEEYLRILYQNVLLRPPDTTGFNYWLSLLQNGQLNRGSVVRWVAAGEEFQTQSPIPQTHPLERQTLEQKQARQQTVCAPNGPCLVNPELQLPIPIVAAEANCLRFELRAGCRSAVVNGASSVEELPGERVRSQI